MTHPHTWEPPQTVVPVPMEALRSLIGLVFGVIVPGVALWVLAITGLLAAFGII